MSAWHSREYHGQLPVGCSQQISDCRNRVVPTSWCRRRLAVKPGLTGMWQVSGRSDITDFEDVVRLDMEYVKNWNIGMDIKILFKTVGVVLKGSGSK